jgi:hypothetical protein
MLRGMTTSRPLHGLETPREPRLGVDIGRVIIHGDGPDTSFIGGSEADALKAPAMSGALEALARLTTFFDGRVWLVSKCGPRIQARTRAWLTAHRFFERTGIAPDHLHFCRERPEKATICKTLMITASSTTASTCSRRCAESSRTASCSARAPLRPRRSCRLRRGSRRNRRL